MNYDISKTFIALKNLNFNCLGFLEIYTLSLSLSLYLLKGTMNLVIKPTLFIWEAKVLIEL